MSSSNKSANNPAAIPTTDPAIIAEGGVPYSSSATRDPLEALDDLMCVVEALTPTWPSREPMKEGKYWLL